MTEENSNAKDNLEEAINKVVKRLQEDESLREELGKKLGKKLSEYFQKQKECGEQGHPNAEVLSYSGPKWRAHMYCPDCKSAYERRLTSAEREKINKSFRKKMDI